MAALAVAILSSLWTCAAPSFCYGTFLLLLDTFMVWSMELRQLRYFVAVAEEGNIGRAAQRLNISQPPISRQIHALEKELGTTLFVRTPKGVELTEPGKVFYGDVQLVLANGRNAVDRARAADRGELGRLDVGFFGSTAYRVVPLALRAFKRANPQIEISLTRMNKTEQVNAIREGRIHIGFGRYYRETRGIAILHVMDEPVYAAIPHDHPLRAGNQIELSDLAKLPVVLYPAGDRPNLADEIISIFRAGRQEIEVDSIAADSTAALSLVACGDRCTIVPEAIASLQFPTLRYVRIAGCDTMVGTSCVYAAERQPPVLKGFLLAIAEMKKDNWIIPILHRNRRP